MTIDEALGKRKILITCGTGGVGKTTLSAAIAMRAALLGRKTVVITIDPAKRLATSLGLKELGDQPADLTPLVEKAYLKAKEKGLSVPDQFTGTFSALMPDTRNTFDSFIDRLAPHPAAAERVKKNPIFQIFAKEFSGTNEYMALQRLMSLHGSPEYDCIILDTPPSRNTLAFLDAPKLLSQFFEERLIRWLVLPANKLLASGMKKALGTLERLTGSGFMTHLFDFASALFDVQVNFTASLKKAMALLESEDVGFIMVTAPTPETRTEVDQFIESIKEHRFHFDGLALNRTFETMKFDQSTSNPKHQKAYEIIHALQKREESLMNNLLRNPIPICAKIPELARDIHSMEDLFHVALALGGSTQF